MPEFLQRYFNDPLALGITAVVAVALLALIVWFLARRGRMKREEYDLNHNQQFAHMEREARFSSAADRMPYEKDAGRVAGDLKGLFEEDLSVRVLAIYAGRGAAERLTNVLEESWQNEEPSGVDGNLSLPDSIPFSLMRQEAKIWYEKPLAFSAERSLQTGPLEVDTDAAARTEDEPVTFIPEREPLPARTEELLVLPWKGAFEWHGLIVGRDPQKSAWGLAPRFFDILSGLMNRLAIALEFQAERTELFALDERATRAARFSRALIAGLEDPSPMGSIASELATLMNADSAALWRVEPDGSMVRMQAAHGLDPADFLPLPIGQGLAGSVAESAEPLALDDAPSDPRCIFPREARESGITSYLGVPVVKDGQVLGVAEVHSAERRTWSEGDKRSLLSAATMMARLFESSETGGERLRVESSYLGLSEALQRLRTPEEVIEAGVEVLGHVLGVSRALIVPLDEGGNPQPVLHEFRDGDTESATGAVFTRDIVEQFGPGEGEPIAINDSRERSLAGGEAASSLHILSEMAAPVRIDDRLLAIIHLHQCDRPREWQRDEVEFLDRVARQISLSLLNVRTLDNATREAQTVKEELRRATEAGGRAQAIVSALPEALLGIDRHGKLTFFNAAARDRFKLGNEHLGAKVSSLEPLTLSDQSYWDQVVGSEGPVHFTSGLTRVPRTEAERAAQGEPSILPLRISGAPLRTKRGDIAGYLVLVSEAGEAERGPGVETEIHDLEQQLAEMARAISEARSADTQARALLAKALAAEAKARAEADVLRHSESDARKERERLRDDLERVQASAKQLLEVNRMKSDFIVGAGREIEASLQSVLGIAEFLEQGSYGELTADQHEAIRGLYGWARRVKNDVDWLIEYGATRSRRLDEGERHGESATNRD
jgi:GAF domain-containing protein